MSTNADAPVDAVSASIVAFTGWGVAKTPRADRATLESVARQAGITPEALAEEVLAAVAVSERVRLPGINATSTEAGPAYTGLLRAALPDLSDAAIDALASRWFFRRIWEGLDTARVTERESTRYFALLAPRGLERAPRALFRRRGDGSGSGAVDEVLRDTDKWGPDEAGRVANAIARYLDSDLEEISPERATEFQQMVAARDYRPFLAP